MDASTSIKKKPFRLLLVSSDLYPPTRVDVAVLQGSEMAKRGHVVDCILQSEAPCRRAYTASWAGGQAWVGPTDTGPSLIRRVHKHVLSIAHDLRLISRLYSGDYDIVEVKDKFLSGIVAMIAARLFGKRFVYWLSYPFPEDYLLRARECGPGRRVLYILRGQTFRWLLYKILLPGADHVFVQSAEMLRDIAGKGIKADRMTAVPMGVGPDIASTTSETKTRRLMPDGVPCLVYIGSLGRSRRLEFLIHVLGNVRRSVPNARLYFVGRGDQPGDENVLESAAQNLGLQDAIVMTGPVPRAEALQYVRESDVCLSPLPPSDVYRVASSTKLVEYMALGKPVVASEQPDQKQLIEESGAGYCVAHDEGQFATAIVQLLQRPTRAKECGELGRSYIIKNRSYTTLAAAVEQRMLALLARSGVGS